jgi:hypothetical protein
MSAFNLYLILKLGAISGLLVGAAVVLIVFVIVSLILWSNSCERGGTENTPVYRKFVFFHMKWAIPTICLCIVIANLLPTTKQAAILYVVPKIVNNSDVQALPGELLTLTREWIQNLRPDVLKSRDSTSLE